MQFFANDGEIVDACAILIQIIILKILAVIFIAQYLTEHTMIYKIMPNTQINPLKKQVCMYNYLKFVGKTIISIWEN